MLTITLERKICKTMELEVDERFSQLLLNTHKSLTVDLGHFRIQIELLELSKDDQSFKAIKRYSIFFKLTV